MARAGDVIEHPVTSERITFLKTAEDTGGEHVRMKLAVGPHGFVSAPHIHPLQEERFEIHQGIFTFMLDGKERQVRAGEGATVPPGTPHAWWNPSDEPGLAIVEFRPALNSEEVFESVFGLAQDGKVDPKTGMPEQPWLALIVLKYRDDGIPVEPPLPDLLEMFGPIAEEAERQGYRLPYPYPYARLREDQRQTA